MVDRWIKVDDRLPNPSDYVLTASRYEYDFMGWKKVNFVINTHIFMGPDDWYNEGSGESNDEVTHWMVLPGVPE